MADIKIDEDLHNRARKTFANNLQGHIHSNSEEKSKRNIEKPLSISNVLWFLSAILTFYITDFARICCFSQEIDRFYFNIAIFLFGVVISIAVWVIYIKGGTSDDWNKLHPYAIPAATACATLGSLCLVIGLWPVWHIFTFPILFILLMGVIVIISNLPVF